MLACAALAGLKHIVTSHAFLERAKISADDFLKAGISLIYLEDVRAGITGSQKFLTLLRHVFRLSSANHNSTAAGSTAELFSPAAQKARPKASNSRTQTFSPTFSGQMLAF